MAVVSQFLQAPHNDCSDTIPLRLDNPSVEYSTINASIHDVGACGTATAGTSKGGIWFSIFGTGNRLRVDTCKFPVYDTQISVFAGNCDDLYCIDGNDDSCGSQSMIAWDSRTGVEYFVFVYGYSTGTGSVGNFSLDFREIGVSTNDNCSNAAQVELGTMHSSSFEGSTNFAKPNNATGYENAIKNENPGAWFSLNGTGEVLEISSCGLSSNFDTQISVFKGRCDYLICVNGGEGSCAIQTSIEWTSEIDVVYFILLNGSERSQKGEFELKFSERIKIDFPKDEQVVTKYGCEGAEPLKVGDTRIGSNTLSSKYEFVETCGTSLPAAPGVWFSVDGTNDNLKVDTCKMSTFDTQISVFTGNCDNLVCVGGNDDFGSCRPKSAVIWYGEMGKSYLIFVYGWANATGDFQIQLMDASEPKNDHCIDAIHLLPGSSYNASTTSASIDAVNDCGNAIGETAPGIWFAVSGTGTLLLASTCHHLNSFDTQISIFTGECSSLICVDGNNDWCGRQSSVFWQSRLDVVYYVLVHGFNNDTGSFRLEIEGPTPTNKKKQKSKPDFWFTS